MKLPSVQRPLCDGAELVLRQTMMKGRHLPSRPRTVTWRAGWRQRTTAGCAVFTNFSLDAVEGEQLLYREIWAKRVLFHP